MMALLRIFCAIAIFPLVFCGDSPCAEQVPCVDQDQCSSYQSQIEELKQLRKDYETTKNETLRSMCKELRSDLRAKVCNKKDKKVCCSDYNSSKPEDSPQFLPSAEKGECGLNNISPSQIIGGEDTALGEYPFMAVLGYKLDNGTVNLLMT